MYLCVGSSLLRLRLCVCERECMLRMIPEPWQVMSVCVCRLCVRLRLRLCVWERWYDLMIPELWHVMNVSVTICVCMCVSESASVCVYAASVLCLWVSVCPFRLQSLGRCWMCVCMCACACVWSVCVWNSACLRRNPRLGRYEYAYVCDKSKRLREREYVYAMRVCVLDWVSMFVMIFDWMRACLWWFPSTKSWWKWQFIYTWQICEREKALGGNWYVRKM